MNYSDKVKLFILTGVIDLFLFLTLYFTKLNFIDKLWIFSVLVSHSLFFYFLSFYNKYVIDLIHKFIFILPVVSIFCSSLFIKFISLFLLIVIQILWVFENRCILNEEDYEWGYGDYLNSFVIVFSVILSINIGYNLQFIPENQYITI
tara:strand:- start:12100 stop:12543 length:444 start_codon:yes stop_codon:yes gene_type:complete